MQEGESRLGRLIHRFIKPIAPEDAVYRDYSRRMRRTKDPVQRTEILREAISVWEANQKARYASMPTDQLINVVLPDVYQAMETVQAEYAANVTLHNRNRVESAMQLTRILRNEIDRRSDTHHADYSQQGSL